MYVCMVYAKRKMRSVTLRKIRRLYIFENELFPTVAVQQRQHVDAVGCVTFFSGLISMFVFDSLSHSWWVHPDLLWMHGAHLKPPSILPFTPPLYNLISFGHTHILQYYLRTSAAVHCCAVSQTVPNSVAVTALKQNPKAQHLAFEHDLEAVLSTPCRLHQLLL